MQFKLKVQSSDAAFPCGEHTRSHCSKVGVSKLGTLRIPLLAMLARELSTSLKSCQLWRAPALKAEAATDTSLVLQTGMWEMGTIPLPSKYIENFYTSLLSSLWREWAAVFLNLTRFSHKLSFCLKGGQGEKLLILFRNLSQHILWEALQQDSCKRDASTTGNGSHVS